MIARDHIGFTTVPTRVHVDAWRVKLFCQAIGEPDPIHWDAEFACAAGLPGCPVPPTFLKALESDHVSSAALLKQMSAPIAKVLHAEQSFDYQHPVYVGDDVEITRSIRDIHDKRNGELTFVVIDTRYRVGTTDNATSVQTILLRNRIGEAT